MFYGFYCRRGIEGGVRGVVFTATGLGKGVVDGITFVANTNNCVNDRATIALTQSNTDITMYSVGRRTITTAITEIRTVNNATGKCVTSIASSRDVNGTVGTTTRRLNNLSVVIRITNKDTQVTNNECIRLISRRSRIVSEILGMGLCNTF